MRTASQDYAIITSDDGKEFLGIALGYDHCAEHEWGIKEIKQRFGIPEGSKKNMGVKSRTITQTIPNLIFEKKTYKKQKFAILYTGYQYWREGEDNPIPHCLENYHKDILWRVEYDEKYPSKHRDPKDPMMTAWSGSGFAVGVMGEKESKWLEELYEAFQNKNVIIAIINHRATNPFAGTSLSLMIADKLPKEVSEMMYGADKKYFDREDYEKKIGMKKIIEKNRVKRQKTDDLYGHDHGYYVACSPKWIDYDDPESRERQKKEHNTKYDILYWINYSDNDNNYGWFTVEDIKEWLTGKKKLVDIRNEAKLQKA